MDPDAWDAVIRINLGGTFSVTRCAASDATRSISGQIVPIDDDSQSAS